MHLEITIEIMLIQMFQKFPVDCPHPDLFEQLSTAILFENITTGRKGTNLVDNRDGLIPIVRTTTIYNQPAQKFQPIHYEIIENIKQISQIQGLKLNNALVEIYDPEYSKMGYHSDQSLDLAQDSYICVFSCYQNPNSKGQRLLVIQDKKTKICSEIKLEHNSVVIFSTETNKNFVHKIILEKNRSENKWLGITFRLSKTLIQFVNLIPVIYPSYKVLQMATKDEIKELRKLKGMENIQIDFDYPEINYTISPSDLLPC